MSNITGGSVSFEQSRKIAEYENRKAVITFNVNAEDGDAEQEVVRALGLAKKHVLEALGFKPQVDVKPSEIKPQVDTAEADKLKAEHAKKLEAKAVKELAPTEPEKRKPGRPPKVPKAEPAPAPAADPAEIANISTGEERVDPSELKTDDLEIPGFLDRTEKPAADAADLGDDSLFEAAAVEVTDQDIRDAVTKRNGVIKNAVAIKKLIAKFTGGPPKTTHDIPQTQRAKFLEELAALT